MNDRQSDSSKIEKKTTQKTEVIIALVGAIIALLALVFGDNVFQQLTHQSFYDWIKGITPNPSTKIIAVRNINEKVVLQSIFEDKKDRWQEIGGEGKDSYIIWYAMKGESFGPMEFPESGNVKSNISLGEFYVEQNTDKYLVIIETNNPNGSHAEGGIIGGAIYSKVSNGWAVEIEEQAITEIGSWGIAPESESIKIGPDRHGVTFKGLWTGGGYCETGLDIIAPVNNSFETVLHTYTSFTNNCGGCGGNIACWGYSSTIQYVKSTNNPDYYDIIIATSGTQDVNGKIVLISETKTYVFDGSKYVLYK